MPTLDEQKVINNSNVTSIRIPLKPISHVQKMLSLDEQTALNDSNAKTTKIPLKITPYIQKLPIREQKEVELTKIVLKASTKIITNKNERTKCFRKSNFNY